MSKPILKSALLLALVGGAMPAGAELVNVSTANTSLVLEATPGSNLRFLYYGANIGDADLQNIRSAGLAEPTAYPVYGMVSGRETAMSVTHADGNMTLDLEVVGVSTKADASAGTNTTTILLRDRFYPFEVSVNYLTYNDADIIETWVEATNNEKKSVTLTEFDSAYMPLRYGNVYMSSLYGSWGNEGRLEEAPLTHGMKEIKNKDGVRNSHTAHAEVMFSLDGMPNERAGRVIGAALCYSGNYRLRVDTDDSNFHHFFAGINPDNSAYHLQRGETFVTPPVAFTYSDQGKGGVSRNFHRWGRNHRLAHGNVPRKVLLNSWEGVYFGINEEGMAQMMSDIASMGGELFVMDDGWFGDKYPRNNDVSSLGDWTVDTRKLPSGIQNLIDTADKNGIKFGLWIEPEMTNSVSELYEQHPEYIIKPTNREPNKGRGGTQLVLDMGNPKVQDLVFNIVDTLMTNYPQLDYIKWDANAPIMNHGSQYLTADNQSHLMINYHKGFAAACERIRAKYPNLTIQACASGGGRANWGVLPWFDEFWTSDDTDALQRVYIQWGTSHFFPAIAMAAHISAAPNHQTRRSIPLKYRIDVAMSGRLGMEIQPKNMSDDEKQLCRRAIEQYKQVRNTIQLGDLYRLLSPYDKLGAASLMYVEPDKSQAVFFWWKTETFCNQQLPRVTMDGLDPDKTYRVEELNRIDNNALPFEGKTFTGKYLMSNGLEMPLGHNVNPSIDYASRVLLLKQL